MSRSLHQTPSGILPLRNSLRLCQLNFRRMVSHELYLPIISRCRWSSGRADSTVTREERLGHLIESYYRATAETFYLSHGKVNYQTFRNKERGKQQIKTILNNLKKLGYNLEYDEKKISQLTDLQAKLEQCCTEAGKIEDKIFEMPDLDWITQSQIKEYVDTLTMTDEEFAKQWETKKKLRDTLKSLVKK